MHVSRAPRDQHAQIMNYFRVLLAETQNPSVLLGALTFYHSWSFETEECFFFF